MSEYECDRALSSASCAQRAVVVTGASSGIGRAIALHLAQRGFWIYATVRNPASAWALKELGEPHLVPIANVDLTEPASIRGAVQTIKDGLDANGLPGLYAVINNAGGGAIAPLELLDIEVLEKELQIRVSGPARLVQMLLPAIRTGRGRILWITTPGLFPLPYKGSIHVSEFATQGLARTFRIELSPWNIPSILIACGGIRSNAVGRMDQQLQQSMSEWSSEQRALYGAALSAVQDRDASIANLGIEAHEVALTVETALCSERPEEMYMVGVSDAFAAMMSLPPAKLDEFFISMVKQSESVDRSSQS